MFLRLDASTLPEHTGEKGGDKNAGRRDALAPKSIEPLFSSSLERSPAFLRSLNNLEYRGKTP